MFVSISQTKKRRLLIPSKVLNEFFDKFGTKFSVHFHDYRNWKIKGAVTIEATYSITLKFSLAYSK